MKAHLRYLSYVLRHKWFVLVAGVRWSEAPLWRLLIHDWSKFLPCEWVPYVRNFYRRGDWTKTYTDKQFNLAWLHHQHWNKHHYQHWILKQDSGPDLMLEMPAGYAREMLADWAGAGRAITGKWDLPTWFEKNKMRLKGDIHEGTWDLVLEYMAEFPRVFRGEEN
jgi:hypothetical protein